MGCCIIAHVLPVRNKDQEIKNEQTENKGQEIKNEQTENKDE